MAAWVEESFGVSCGASGLTARRHRLGFVYKKPKLVPAKADAEAQKKLLADYEKLEQHHQEAPIYSMDAVHPQHNPPLGCGWIKRGQAQPIPTHSGRRRLNLNGTIELGRLQPLAHFGERIDADATIALLQRIEQVHFSAAWIFVICDNARYYRARAVDDYRLMTTARPHGSSCLCYVSCG